MLRTLADHLPAKAQSIQSAVTAAVHRPGSGTRALVSKESNAVPAGVDKVSAKKDTEERQYSEAHFQAMLVRVVSGEAGAERAAREAGIPSATSSLKTYAKEIRENPALKRDSEAETRKAWVQAAAQVVLKEQGSLNFRARKVFSKSERDYWARGIKLYADMGSWPIDVDALSALFADMRPRRSHPKESSKRPLKPT